MVKRLNLTLPDKSARFVEMSSGPGTDFVNETDFVRHCIREKRRQLVEQATAQYIKEHVEIIEELEDAIENKKYYLMDEVSKDILGDL